MLHKTRWTNLLEERTTELSVNGNTVAFHVRPYQIVTLRLKSA